MSAYVAAYDITEDNRRNRVARILDHYGHRVQQSVFPVWIESEQLSELRLSLADHLEADDRFDLFPVDQRGARKHWRWLRPINDYDPVILL